MHFSAFPWLVQRCGPTFGWNCLFLQLSAADCRSQVLAFRLYRSRIQQAPFLFFGDGRARPLKYCFVFCSPGCWEPFWLPLGFWGSFWARGLAALTFLFSALIGDLLRNWMGWKLRGLSGRQQNNAESSKNVYWFLFGDSSCRQASVRMRNKMNKD